MYRMGRPASAFPGWTGTTTYSRFYSEIDLLTYGSTPTSVVNRTMVNSSDNIGKQFVTTSGGKYFRGRAGFYFALPTWTTAPTVATLTFQTYGGSSASENALPQVWVSAADWSGWALGWQNDLSQLCGTGIITGGLTNYANQSISVPIGALVSGANLSFVIGQSYELATGGVSSAPAQSYFQFPHGGTSIQLALS